VPPVPPLLKLPEPSLPEEQAAPANTPKRENHRAAVSKE
jgi:hypothetical protein